MLKHKNLQKKTSSQIFNGFIEVQDLSGVQLLLHDCIYDSEKGVLLLPPPLCYGSLDFIGRKHPLQLLASQQPFLHSKSCITLAANAPETMSSMFLTSPIDSKRIMHCTFSLTSERPDHRVRDSCTSPQM